ncbi:hypothetical protein ACFWUQ_04430 [Streptomyces sp. NPDC058662]|uniref:hypothetical protein n=1 Tax=Streptomyces sp. NPDC058662 TaxID=3346583 RepID=UPI00366329AC
MSTVSRRTLVRAAAVAACAGSLLALPAAAALAEGVPAVSAAHSAAPPRTLVKTVALADGVSTARVYRIAGNVHQADILAADGRKLATLTSGDGAAGAGSAGALHAVLSADGQLTSWVGGIPARGGGPGVVEGAYKTGTRSGGAVPAAVPNPPGGGGAVVGTRPADVPRLNTLADGPGEGVLLLAAGGGLAAVGAAGLGFAMLRRGRTEG